MSKSNRWSFRGRFKPRRLFQAISVLFIGVAVCSLIPKDIDFLKTSIAVARYQNPIWWQDEGINYYPLSRVQSGGYWNYRCEEDNGGGCYGGFQIFSDALLSAALIPKASIQDTEYIKPPTANWPWVSRSLADAVFLRSSRVAYALLFILGLIVLTVRADWRLSLLISLWAISLPTMDVSIQGYKNDFPAIAWTLLYLFLYLRSFAPHLPWQSRTKRLLIAISAGMAGILVRPSLLPTVVLGLVFYAIWDVFLSDDSPRFYARVKRSALTVVGALAVMVVVFVIFTPSIFISSDEVKTLFYYLILVKGGAGADHWNEWRIARCSLAPLVTFLLTLPWILRSLDRRRFGVLAILIMSVIGYALIIKTAPGRVHYYLFPVSVAVCGLALCVRYLPLTRKPVFWSAVLLIILGGNLDLKGSLKAIGESYSQLSTPVDLRNRAYIYSDVTQTLAELKASDFSAEHYLLVDLNVRPALLKREWLNKVQFFDSVTEAPEEIFAKHGKSAKKVVVLCWGERADATPADASFLNSSAIPAWIPGIRQLCSHTIDARAALHSYYVFDGPMHSAVMDPSRLSTNSAPTISDQVTQLEFRTMQGAIEGVNSWKGPLIFRKPTQLVGTWKWKTRPKSLTLKLRSACKSPGELIAHWTAEWNVDQIKSSDIHIVSLDVTTQYCTEYSLRCKFNFPFLKWWFQKDYPITASIPVPGSGKNLRFKLGLRGEFNRCSIILDSIEVGR